MSEDKEKKVSISVMWSDGVVGKRIQSASFPEDIDYTSYVGRSIVTHPDGSMDIVSFEDFLKSVESSVFVRVDRVRANEGNDVYRIVCLMPDGECMEAPLFSLSEVRSLLSLESMRLKPASWLGRSVLLTKGSLGLDEKSGHEKGYGHAVLSGGYEIGY